MIPGYEAGAIQIDLPPTMDFLPAISPPSMPLCHHKALLKITFSPRSYPLSLFAKRNLSHFHALVLSVPQPAMFFPTSSTSYSSVSLHGALPNFKGRISVTPSPRLSNTWLTFLLLLTLFQCFLAADAPAFPTHFSDVGASFPLRP